ncbi:hypothetical protein ACET3X_006206 [Alternaria dauci]|uniref:Tachykinin family protein n=1 Tax=Alternaria dauci TaxID=48095 RepID=A0ABR3UHL8_9PLEO
MAISAERQYEFFVTTDEPHQPAGVERSTIRRLVMRNYFDTKIAGPQFNVPEHSSMSAVVAEKQLKSRFRLSGLGIEKRKSLSRQKEYLCKETKGEKRRPQVLRTRSGPTPLSSTIGTGNSGIGHYNETEHSTSRRNPSEPAPERSVPKADLDTHHVDPFGAPPIPDTPQLDALFRLYKSSHKNNSIGPDAMHTWKSFILNDAGLLHGTLASWALYGMLVNGSHDLRVCELEHKNEAVRTVTYKLAMCRGSVPDDVVGTVLTLANLENLTGAYDVAQLHLTALRAMVEERGGILAFEKNDGLTRGILWVDFHAAAASRTSPSFPHVWLGPDAPLPDKLHDEATHTSPTSLLQLSCAAIECFNIFYRLHRLALATSSHWTGRVARVALSNLLYTTQFILLSVPDRSQDFLEFDQSIQDRGSEYHGFEKHGADAASIVEALLAAALIFIYAVLRALPLKTKIFAILLQRLRTAVDRPNTSVLETWQREKNLNMLLWALVMACCVATGAERTWWTTQLCGVCKEMNIGSREQLEHEMRRVAWTDSFFDDRIDGIWAEAMQASEDRTSWDSK